MKFVDVQPDEVITTRDFPVYSPEVLEKYFDLYKNGRDKVLPPVPLIDVNRYLTHFDEPEYSLLLEFLSQNPDVRFFLLNGSHRTTSANLNRILIRGMVLETIADIQVAKEIRCNGKRYEHGLLDTIDENIKDLIEHFRGTKLFQTVQHKTDQMINQRVIPPYMYD